MTKSITRGAKSEEGEPMLENFEDLELLMQEYSAKEALKQKKG